MSQSVQHYVNVSVALEGNGAVPATLSRPMLVHEQDSLPDRLQGPFTSPADVLDYGYASGSPPHLFAQAIAAQQPRVSEFMIGRRATADASLGDALDAIYAVNPSGWYCTMEETRESSELEDLAVWTEASGNKIALAQSNDASMLSGQGPSYNALFEGTVADGTYVLTFTGFGLASPVTVTATRAAGTPATLALVADAFRTQLTTQAGTDLEDVVELASIGGTSPNVSFRIADGLPAGTVVASGTAVASTADLTVTTTDMDIASVLFRAQYTRTALIYHPTDAQFLDASWASRCMSANLDQRKLDWAFKRLNGIDGTELTDAQVTALRAVNANYFAPAQMGSGSAVQAFTAQGWVSSGEAGEGRRIDTTITLDWAKFRMEEALLNVRLREPNSVVFDNPGIARFGAAVRGVFSTGLAAKHFIEFEVPEGEDLEFTQTPAIFLPTLAQTTTSQRQARTLTFSALAYLAESIEKVNFSLTARR